MQCILILGGDQSGSLATGQDNEHLLFCLRSSPVDINRADCTAGIGDIIHSLSGAVYAHNKHTLGRPLRRPASPKEASHKARGQKVQRPGGGPQNSIDLHHRPHQQWPFDTAPRQPWRPHTGLTIAFQQKHTTPQPASVSRS